MKVTVKLFATFREGRQKVIVMDLEDGTTMKHITDMLGIEKDEIAISLLNGRDGELERLVSEGDVVALFPPVGGG